MRDGYQRKTKRIFIACEASHRYSNERRFDSCAPTQVCRFENHALCACYPDGQANCPTFQRKVLKRRDDYAADDTCYRLVNVYQIHHQTSIASRRRQSKD
jgi:hypothetical protein